MTSSEIDDLRKEAQARLERSRFDAEVNRFLQDRLVDLNDRDVELVQDRLGDVRDRSSLPR